jgi:hypothetical protein
MTNTRTISRCALLVVFSLVGCTPSKTSDSPPTPAGFVRLAGGAHPAALPEFDRGPLEASKRIANLSMVFKLSPAQLADREALKAELADPRSPRFRKFLTTSEYVARFGAPRERIERAKSWLQSQGLEVHDDSPLGARVTFSGTVDKLQSAFHADMRRYEVDGEQHYAMRAAPALPADLAAAVITITNTHDFHPKPFLKMPANPQYVSPKATGFAPPDWANVYDAAKLYITGVGGKKIDGTGVSIAVVGRAQIAQSDIDAWRTTFNLPASTVTMTLVPNSGPAIDGQQGIGFEAVLDVEWSGGIAPGATINYVYLGQNDTNIDDASFYAIENNLAPVLSESWGGCEAYYFQAGYTAADQNLFDVYGSAANVLGITYVAASGDAGATTCLGGGNIAGLYISLPAGYPGVTSVGGTQFPTGSLTGSPYFTAYSAMEATWDEVRAPPNIGAGGGGVSQLFNRPSYQSAIPDCAMVGTLPITGVNQSNQRQVPDVAFTSAYGHGMIPLLMECTAFTGGDCTSAGGSPQFFGAGGTSFATPAFAGVVALMNQAAGGRLGNINPLLYTLSASTPSAFHDITLGSNEVSCRPGTDPGCPAGGLYGFPAGSGYDCATGLGSADVYNLVAAVYGQAATNTTLAVAPNPTTEGSPVNFTAHVTAPVPNTSAIGGVVTFAFTSYDQNGNIDLSWTLGTGTITTGTTALGTATFSGAVPPGMVKPGMQSVDVVAMYDCDATHLPSTSAKVSLAFGPVALAILPSAPTVQVGGMLNLTTTGGVAPVKWLLGKDTTCDMSNPPKCSTVVEATGAFTAGAVVGTTAVYAIDADGAEAFVTVNVICTPKTQCAAGLNCGSVSNGCGGMLSCGTCTAPQFCGGGSPGVANVCGCTPISKCPTGKNCGSLSNGCGGMIACGTCTAPQTCGGGSPAVANVCGCAALKACPAGDNCGSVADGCGGMLSCGTCTPAQTCTANQCVDNAVDAGASANSGGGSDAGSSGGGHGGCEMAGGPRAPSFALLLIAAAIGLARRRRASRFPVR